MYTNDSLLPAPAYFWMVSREEEFQVLENFEQY